MLTLAILVIALTVGAWFAGPRSSRLHKSRWWVMLLVSLFQLGCTSMQRIDATPEELQSQVRAGKYLHTGQDVTIVTRQETKLWFRFRRIDNDALVGETQLGEEASVPIADVAGIKTNRFNVGRSVALVGGGFLIYVATISALLIAAY